MVTPSVLRVRFTQDPFLANPSNSNDGLHVANYTLTGPAPVSITSAAIVGGDPQSVDLILNTPLITGTWKLSAANIQTPAATGLSAPTALTIAVVYNSAQVPVHGNASSDSSESLLRKFFNPALKGPAWSALLAGLATGDTTNKENSELAFDQMFLVSAGGFYLDRLANDQGVQRPAGVGMSDELFSKYAIRTSADKLTQESFNEVLEIMYGMDSVRAFAATGIHGTIDTGCEPFPLSDQDSLRVLIDGVEDLTITFRSAQFNNIAAASAIEVSSAITETLRILGSEAFAIPVLDVEDGVNRVNIYSPSLGLSGSVQVLGGKAQNSLRFNDWIDVYLHPINPLPVWTITFNAVSGVLHFETNLFTPIDLTNLHTDDYVVISGAEFNANNRGTFTVTRSGFLNPDIHFFEVVNSAGVAEVVTQQVPETMLFFRPTKRTIHAQGTRAAYVSQAAGSGIVVVPATSLAVQRTVKHAAYNHVNPSVTVELIVSISGIITTTRNTLGTVIVQKVGHGLVTGDQVLIDNVVLDPAPAPLEGYGSSNKETFFSQNTITSTSFSSSKARRYHVAVKMIDDRVVELGGENLVGGALVADIEEFLIRQEVVPETLSIAANLMSRAGVTVSVSTAVPHHLIVDQAVFLKPGEANFPGGFKLVSNIPDDFTFEYTEAGAATASAFDQVFVISQVGAKAYDYTRVASGNLLTNREFLFGTLLESGVRAGQILITGGQNTVNVMTNTTELYIPGVFGAVGANLAGPNMSLSRAGHRATFLSFGDKIGKVLIVGGLTGGGTGGTLSCDLYTPSTNLIAATSNTKFGHVLHTQTLLQDSRVLVTGGKTGAFLNDTGAANLPTHRCETYSQHTGNWTVVASMNFARFGHAAVLLPDGRVMVVGGYGHNAMTELAGVAVPYLIKNVEIYDPNTGLWSSCGKLQVGRYLPMAVYVSASNKVYVSGGDSTVIEYYDVTRGEWFVSPGTLVNSRPGAAWAQLNNEEVYICGGDYQAPVVAQSSSLFIPNSDRFYSGQIGGIYQITKIDDDSFEFQTGYKDYGGFNIYSSKQQTVVYTPFKASASTTPGPFTFNPHGGLAVTSKESTTSQVLTKGQQYASVSVADATQFPDSEGWLVFGFGTSQQLGPVKYLGRLSPTSLSLDFKFKFPLDVASGEDVTLLLQKGPWDPDASELGAFYITPSPAGRIAAEDTIEDISGAGIGLEKIVVYPGDRGLGAVSYPVRASYKLSDVVAMFAGDDQAADVAKERVG